MPILGVSSRPSTTTCAARTTRWVPMLAHVSHATDALHSTAESHDRVIVVETMGRSVGWLAVAAGLAEGAM